MPSHPQPRSMRRRSLIKRAARCRVGVAALFGVMLAVSALAQRQPNASGIVDIFPVVPPGASDDTEALRMAAIFLEKGNVRDAEEAVLPILLREAPTLLTLDQKNPTYFVDSWSRVQRWVGRHDALDPWWSQTIRHRAQLAVDEANALPGEARERALVAAYHRYRGLLPSTHAALDVAVLRLEAGRLLEARAMLDRVRVAMEGHGQEALQQRFASIADGLRVAEVAVARTEPAQAPQRPAGLVEAWSVGYVNTDRRPTHVHVNGRAYHPNITAWGRMLGARVAINTKNSVMALGPDDGQVHWRFGWDAATAGVPKLWDTWHQPDQRSVVASEDGSAWFAVVGPTTTFMSNTKPVGNALVSLRAEDGALLWDRRGTRFADNEWAGWFYAGTPAVWRGWVIAAMVSNSADGHRMTRVVMHDAATGAVMRTIDISKARSARRSSAGGALPKLAVLADRLVVNDGVGLAAGVDLVTGSLRWSTRLPDVDGRTDTLAPLRHLSKDTRMMPQVTEPVALGQGVVLQSPANHRGVYLLDPDTGRLLRDGPMMRQAHELICAGDFLLTVSFRDLRLHDVRKQRWAKPFDNGSYQRHRSIAFWQGMPVACSMQKVLVFDPVTGGVAATVDRGRRGTPIAAGQTLIVVDEQRIVGYREAGAAAD